MDWISMSSHNSLVRVGLDSGVVDMRTLNNFLDGMILEGSWDWDSMWDGDGDINFVVLDIDLWDNVGDLRGDSGVGSDGSSDILLDNSVSRDRFSYDRVRGNGSIRCWRSRDSWGSNRSGLNNVLRSSGNKRMGRLGNGILSSNSITMSSNNLLYSGLNGPVSDNCKLVKMVVIAICGFWKSSSINI